MICDICEREIKGKLAASRRGRWGLNLCHACWQRLRKREIAQQGRQPTLAERAEAAQADGPPYAWPACEFCGEDVDQHGLGYYTTKGKPRRFCSLLCRQTHNSRVGAPIRSVKIKQRIQSGLWENPAKYHTPESLKAAALAGAAVRAEQHREALKTGTWRNPANAPGAREKLSKPRLHGDNPVLHAAIEKLNQGLHITALTTEEAEAYRKHRREQDRRLRQRPPNLAFREARERAGLSKAEMARRLGVALNTVWNWEAHGAIPRNAETRRRVADLLDCWPWEVSEHD